MELQTFLAKSAPEAVTQIRERLGPEAVVVNVRKLPASGLSRLWQKPRIEVLAFRPEPVRPAPDFPAALTELQQELSSLKERMERGSGRTFQGPIPRAEGRATRSSVSQTNTAVELHTEDSLTRPSAGKGPSLPVLAKDRAFANRGAPKTATSWRIGPVLESTGLLPIHAQQVVETLCDRHGTTPPESLAKEIELAATALASLWRSATNADARRAHIFIGGPGSGKTICLCQWLTRATLLEGRSARVWRLDGRSANHAESLSVYAEILGVPLDRFVPDAPPPEADLLFIDLPGVNWTDATAVQALAQQVSRLPPSKIHLVLNAAYETEVLFGQIRAFGGVSLTDLIFTHLDEEPQWGKLWNFVLGTNYTIGCLGAGQNVPGDFQLASPEAILNRQFLRK
jgi:flagellar biosynthesis protein FlhF